MTAVKKAATAPDPSPSDGAPGQAAKAPEAITCEALISRPVPFTPWGCVGPAVLLVAGQSFDFTLAADVEREAVEKSINASRVIKVVSKS